MPSNIDIFSNIKIKDIQKNSSWELQEAFLSEVKHYLFHLSSERLIENNLSRLAYSKQDDGSNLFEWNFDNFRLGFTFDSNESSSGFYIVSDTEISGDFSTISNYITRSNVVDVAHRAVDFVLGNT